MSLQESVREFLRFMDTCVSHSVPHLVDALKVQGFLQFSSLTQLPKATVRSYFIVHTLGEDCLVRLRTFVVNHHVLILLLEVSQTMSSVD